MEQYTVDCIKNELKCFKDIDKFRIRENDGAILLQNNGVDFAKVLGDPPKMCWIDGTIGTLLSFDSVKFDIIHDMKLKINSGEFDC